MKKAFTAFICVIVTFGLAQPSSAFDIGRRSSEEKVFSAAATITAPSASAFLAEIPEGKAYLVTQYCTSAAFGPVLVGSSFGALVNDSDSGGCTAYTPGVLLQGGQTLSCVSQFGPPSPDFDIQCLVTGFIRNRY